MTTRKHLAWIPLGYPGSAFVAPLDIPYVSDTNHICRVTCADRPRNDRCIPRSRLWCYDASEVYRAFAREEALKVAHLWEPPPGALRYLKTGDESLRRATAAATEIEPATLHDHTNPVARANAAAAWAARAARWATQTHPTWGTARDVTRDVANAAIRAATAQESTARGRDQARGPARARQNRRLATLLIAGRRLYGQRVVP